MAHFPKVAKMTKHAFCTLCLFHVDVSSKGKGAIERHVNSDKLEKGRWSAGIPSVQSWTLRTPSPASRPVYVRLSWSGQQSAAWVPLTRPLWCPRCGNAAGAPGCTGSTYGRRQSWKRSPHGLQEKKKEEEEKNGMFLSRGESRCIVQVTGSSSFCSVPLALTMGRKWVNMSLVAKKLVFRVTSAWTANGAGSATGWMERKEVDVMSLFIKAVCFSWIRQNRLVYLHRPHWGRVQPE